MKKLKHVLILVAFGLLNVVCVSAAEKFISFTQGDLKLCKTGDSFSICISDNDNIAVKLAARNLASDFQKVCDANVTISSSDSEARIIAGTIGNSAAIDQLVKSGKIDAKSLNGKIEKYILNIIDGTLMYASLAPAMASAVSAITGVSSARWSAMMVESVSVPDILGII